MWKSRWYERCQQDQILQQHSLETHHNPQLRHSHLDSRPCRQESRFLGHQYGSN